MIKNTLLKTALICLSCSWTIAKSSEHGSKTFLSSSRLGSPVEESSNSTVVLDKEILEASGSRNIADVLRLVPGFFVGYKYGNQASIGYSMHPDELTKRIQVLLDGRTLYLNTTGGVMYQNLPVQLEDIEKIEVVRGPSAALHGPNSMLATVHIYTAHASERQGAEASVRTGGNGIEDYYAQYSSGFNDLYFTTSANYHSDEGLEGRFDSRKDFAGWSRLDYLLNQSNELSLQIGYSDSEYEAGGTDPLFDPNRNIYQYHKFVNFNWKNSDLSGDDFKLKASISDFENDHRWRSGAPIDPFGYLYFDINYDFVSQKLELEKTISFSDRFKVVLAAGHHKDRTKAPGSLYPNTGESLDSDTTQVYGVGEYRTEKNWLFTVGLMAEKSSLSEDDIELSPQLSTHYFISENQTLKFGYFEGARTPVAYDVYGARAIFTDAGINVYRSYPTFEIESERVKTIDASYQIHSRAGRFEARIYDTTTKNLIGKNIIPTPEGIFSLTGPYLFSFDNLEGETHTQGLELFADYRLTPALRAVAGYSITNTNSTVPVNPENPDQNVAAPKVTGSALLSYRMDNNVKLSMMYAYADKVYWENESSDSLNKLDIKASKCWTGNTVSRFCLAVVGSHVSGQTRDFLADRHSDRSFFIEANVSL